MVVAPGAGFWHRHQVDLKALPTADFRVHFVVEARAQGVIEYEPMHVAIAEALGLAPKVTPKYTSIGAVSSASPRPGDRFEGLARINSVRGVTGQKIAMIAYSFYLTLRGSLALSSVDLDASAAYRKPNELWFRDGEHPVLLTDTLRAAVKALAPTRPRAAKRP